jgi:c-di-GMP-binding flagellar brake protein YcgR
MAEHETQADVEQAPPKFELEQSDDYSRFMLNAPAEILAVLRTLIQKGAMITAHFDQGKSFLLTSMIALTNDNSEFVLDIGSNDEMNRRALVAKKLILTTVVDKVKIQFSLSKLSATQNDGRPAFLGSVPSSLLRLQRRDYFRLATPIASPVKLAVTVRRTDGSALDLEVPLFDISGGGVGVMATPDQAEFFQRGSILNECKLVLPEEGTLVTNLYVRNTFDVTTRNGSRYVRVGCEYLDLPAPRLTIVHRYITRIERERKARQSGMA